MKPRIALIGISGYGKVHFDQIRKLADAGRVDIAAAVVINPDQVAPQLEILKQYGTVVYNSTQTMYADFSGKLDLVCIPTGIALHEPMAIEALAHGANVLVEKPAAGSVEAISNMMNAEKNSNGKFIAVGFQHIYAREIQFIKNYLLTGRLGKIKSVTSKGLWPRNDNYYNRNNWSGKIKAADGSLILDSPINNAFAHYLNLELFLSGDAFHTSAHPVEFEAELYRARKEIETFDTCGVRVKTSNGVTIVTLLTHTVAENNNPQIGIECENGEVYWKLDESWNIRNSAGRIIHSGLAESPHSDMFADVIARIADSSVFTCSLEIAKEHTFCIEELYHRFTPVQLTEHSMKRTEPDGQYLLNNVESVFETCFRNNQLPSEAGADWK